MLPDSIKHIMSSIDIGGGDVSFHPGVGEKRMTAKSK